MNQISKRSPAERIATVMRGPAPALSSDSMMRLRKVRAEIRAFLEAQDPPSNEAQQPATQETHERASQDVREPASQEAQEPTSVDAAWMVMEAANDFGDQATIDACRRVIDASLNGAIAAESDVALVNNYFK
jgi:hypothetical protein